MDQQNPSPSVNPNPAPNPAGPMDKHMQPALLTRYSFVWSQVRLIIAAVALFLGAKPLAYILTPDFISGFVSVFLTLFWIVSGMASAYLFYRWYTGGKTLFSKKEQQDLIAFFVSIVSGINFGYSRVVTSKHWTVYQLKPFRTLSRWSCLSLGILSTE